MRNGMTMNDQTAYPVDEWCVRETRFSLPHIGQSETIFSLGNGYLGMRGNYDEGTPVFQNGTYINGFFESRPIIYGEKAYGYAKNSQTMLNITDTKVIKLYVDDEPFDLCMGTILRYHRVLDMKSASLIREVLWESPSGKRIFLKSQRLVSFHDRHLAAISYQVSVLNSDAWLDISSEMISNESNQVSDGDPREAAPLYGQVLLPRGAYTADTRVFQSHTTRNSRLTFACGMEHRIETGCPCTYTAECSKSSGRVVFSIKAEAEKMVNLTKFVAYHSSKTSAPMELCAMAEKTLLRASTEGFTKLLENQKQYMDDFWRNSDVTIDGDVAIQQGLRFSLFQILQSAGRDGHTGIAAKGLTGQGYEGHHFWDAEIYVLPFLIYTVPEIAKKLLEFRYHMLDWGRKRAQEMSQRGALFPWRTIDGEESSAYFLAGTAQYHINADIIYGLKKYVDATGDEEFLLGPGAEMLVETARFWNDLGCYPEEKRGKFCINAVTGPDEYTVLVNNNVYTNLMARQNLTYAASTVEFLKDKHPELFSALVEKTGLKAFEINDWKKAAENMYIPFDEERGIHPQDDSFFEKSVWDFANTPAENYPLLLHYHPLIIYRFQVMKQPDLVLAMFLHRQYFSTEQKKHNFDYYERLTTGDSSLSPSIQAIIAAEVGYLERAYEYFMETTVMDLDDIDHNVSDGVHIASMAGAWLAVVYGFAGMGDDDGCLTFAPRLPEKWKKLRFPLTARGQMQTVDIDQESATYCLVKGSELVIKHEGEEIRLSVGEPVSVNLRPSRPAQNSE